MARVKDQVATVEHLKALAHPMRWRVLRLCRDEPLTNQELAERLGVAPPTMLRHVRILVAHGFLEPEPVRSGRQGAMERPYRSTGLTLRLALHDVDDAGLRRDVDLAALAAHHDEALEAPPGSTRSRARGVLRLGPESQRELGERMAALLDEYRERDDEDGEDLSFLWHLIRRPGREPS